MLSPVSRGLTFGLALYYFVLGVILFIAPASMSEVFAWKVSPFVTMTIGGWCLGNAWLALVAGRRWRWNSVYACLVYLWIFGILELAVALFFRDKLRLAHPIAWLYLGTLLFSLLAAVVGIIDWLRLRPSIRPYGRPVKLITRILVLLFAVVVGFLGIYGMVAKLGWPATNAGVFPELLSLFTLRSFGAFYLSLAIAALVLVSQRGMGAGMTFLFSAYGLIIFITAAAFWYIELFDFLHYPGRLIYLGTYLVVAFISLVYLVIYGTGRIPREQAE